MLSRVADSLYWMSRYFERADNTARAIEATHGLMLSRGEVAHDQRWYRALTNLGLPSDARDQDPQVASAASRGYLHHGNDDNDRSSDGATHAWVEAFLPRLGWVGFDPTNNLVAGGRHIRTATGRDYSDVPPTLGTMKGRTDTELQVRVRVAPSQTLLPPDEDFTADEEWSLFIQDEEPAPPEVDQPQQ